MVVLAIALVVGVLVVVWFMMGFRSSKSRRNLAEEVYEMDDVRMEIEKGHIPHVGTYTHVMFSDDGQEENNAVIELLNCIDEAKRVPDEVYMLMLRLCMTANEMNVDTGDVGNMRWPPGMVQVASLRATASKRPEVFGKMLLAHVEGDLGVPIVVIRGTSSTQDWLCDAQIKKEPLSVILQDSKLKGSVHVGFGYLYRSMCRQIIECLLRVANTQGGLENVIVTGHSLGAAIATLAAYHIHKWSQGRLRVMLFTFGSPRVGDKAFAKDFSSITGIHSLRVVNEKDYVTEIPPNINGYAHVHYKVSVDISPRTVGLPDDYSEHNLYTYMFSFDPDAQDIVCATEFLSIKS